jgi:cytochrome c oxidase subunit 2
MTLAPIFNLFAAATVTTDTGVNSDYWVLPSDASSTGDATSWLFWLITYITIFFSVVVTVAMIWFVIRYRQKGGIPAEGKGASHSTTLEITWTLIPTMIVLIIFVYGFRVYLDKTIAPDDANQINVQGYMWAWNFTYPDGGGGMSQDLVVPVNEPVKLTMTSKDVIHSVYIPAFRVKKDAVPGRFNSLWFQADELGTYELFCTEYCGTLHSKMGAKVQVVTREEYDKHLEVISNPYIDAEGNPVPFAEVGEMYWNNLCISCHSVDGSVGTGPSWLGIYGEVHQMVDGEQVEVDLDYIRESILYPGNRIIEGWGNAMPAFVGQLDERDIVAITAYIATLSDGYEVGADGQIIGPDNTSTGGPGLEDGEATEFQGSAIGE